jgi:hypothetical protein
MPSWLFGEGTHPYRAFALFYAVLFETIVWILLVHLQPKQEKRFCKK